MKHTLAIFAAPLLAPLADHCAAVDTKPVRVFNLVDESIGEAMKRLLDLK